MTRIIVLCVMSLALESCSAVPKSFRLPTLAEPALDPRICAEPQIEPEIPEGAGLIQPATPVEMTAHWEFIQWAQEHQRWGRRGWEIVEIAREAC